MRRHLIMAPLYIPCALMAMLWLGACGDSGGDATGGSLFDINSGGGDETGDQADVVGDDSGDADPGEGDTFEDAAGGGPDETGDLADTGADDEDGVDPVCEDSCATDYPEPPECAVAVWDPDSCTCSLVDADEGAECDDGLPCTVGSVCQLGFCLEGPTKNNCFDDDPCTVDDCDPVAGCVHAAFDCDDANDCTVDTCEAGDGCTYLPADGEACDDGSECTTADLCLDGVCQGELDPACPEHPCTGDPLRNIYVNYLLEATCSVFDDDQASCELAWQGFGQGPVACGWKETQAGKTQCVACNGGQCENACDAPPCSDDDRVWHLGPAIEGCGWFSGDAASCDLGYEGGDGGDLTTSCYVDGGACKPCTPAAQLEGACGNTCGGPVAACVGDFERVVDAKSTLKGNCTAFDGDEAGCGAAFLETSGGVASCYWKANNDTCKACSTALEEAGACVNECAAPGCVDDSKTVYIGEAPAGGCALLDADPATCGDAYETQGDGNAPLSCWHTGEACTTCSPDAQLSGACAQTCGPPIVVCSGAPSRALVDSEDGCELYDESPAECEAAFEDSVTGPVSCFHKVKTTGEGSCVKCIGAVAGNECNNACEAPACKTDPAVTLYTAEMGCGMFDGDPAACGAAYVEHAVTYTLVSCWHDGQTCSSCGSADECTNTCAGAAPACTGDMSRIINVNATHDGCAFFDGEPELCEKAYGMDGLGAVACYFSSGGGAGGGKCKPCAESAEKDGLCVDVCDAPACADEDKVWHVESCGDSADEYTCGLTYTGGDGATDACWWNDAGACVVCQPGSPSCLETCGP